MPPEASAKPARRRVPRLLATGLKILVSLAAVFLIVRKVDFSSTWEQLARAHAGWFALCLALQYLVAALNAQRWKSLIDAPGLSLRKYLYYVFVGYFFAAFLPSAAFAEGLRTYAFGKRYGAVQKNFVAMLVSRGMGLAVSLLLATLFGLAALPEILALPLWRNLRVAPGAWALAAILVVAGLAAVAAIFRARAASVLADLRSFLTARRIAAVSFVSLLIQIAMIFTTVALFRSVGRDLPVWQAAFIPLAVQLLLLLPVSFGGVGVREYLNLAFYGQLGGIPAATVLAASLLAYVPVLALAGTGGLWILLRRRARKSEET